jgi:hypothetical protein
LRYSIEGPERVPVRRNTGESRAMPRSRVLSYRRLFVGGLVIYILVTLFCRFAPPIPGPAFVWSILGPPVILANRSENADENHIYLLIYFVGTVLFFAFSLFGVICWNRRQSYRYENLAIILGLLAVFTWVVFGLLGISPAV